VSPLRRGLTVRPVQYVEMANGGTLRCAAGAPSLPGPASRRLGSGRSLAAAYDVHTNTIARWLGRARQTLEAKVKQGLAGRLALNEEQLASVLRLIRSQLDVTLGRLLDGQPEAAEAPGQ
jgi:hypothetical protein